MIQVLGVDPGKASGIAFLEWDNETPDALPTIIWTTEVDSSTFGNHILAAFNENDEEDGVPIVVSCERFTITAKTVSNSQAPWSLEQIGVLKYLCSIRDYAPEKIVFQSPADAKKMFPNSALKTVGTWAVGTEGHALDAIRHALLVLVKLGWVPRILLP